MITLTIAGDHANEVFTTIRDLFAALPGAPEVGHLLTPPSEYPTAISSPYIPQAAPAPMPHPVIPVAPLQAAPVNPTHAAAPAPVVTAPYQTPATVAQPQGNVVPAPMPAAVPTAPAPAYTIERVANAGAALVESNPGIMPQLFGLLNQYGVQAVTELKPDQLGPFATALRGMGARI